MNKSDIVNQGEFMLKKGKEYKCDLTGQIFEFVGWDIENEVPFVRNNYNRLFNEGKKKQWCLGLLKNEASSDDIDKYQNNLINSHNIGGINITLDEDGESYLFIDSGYSLITQSDLEAALDIVKKGFIKQYE